MGGRLAEHTLDIPYNKQNSYGQDAIFYGVWNIICYTSENKNVELQNLKF